MSAMDEWQAARERARIAYAAKWGAGREPRNDAERVEQSRDFQVWMDDAKAAWRGFAAADPDTAAQLFAENMLKISDLSHHHHV